MKSKLLIMLASVMLLSAGSVMGQTVSLEPIYGAGTAWGGNHDYILTGDTVQFNLRFEGGGGDDFGGFTNGIKLYSPNNPAVSWDSLWADSTGTLGKTTNFDLLFQFSVYSYDSTISDTAYWTQHASSGDGEDMIGFEGSKMFGPGMSGDFDDNVFTITFGPIDSMYSGDTLCLDSSYYPPSGTWLWAWHTGGGTILPAWGGPYCFEIVDNIDQLGVREAAGDGNLPKTWAMSQNYPNPFNPTTEIAFDVPRASFVTVTVFNVLGQKITDLVDETLAAGSYTTTWDGRTGNGTEVSSGVYFYRIDSDNFTQTKKMMLLK